MKSYSLRLIGAGMVLLASTTSVFAYSETSTPELLITDGAYTGTSGEPTLGFGPSAGMDCDVIDTTGDISGNIIDVNVDIDMDMTWIGDLVIKLQSPDGAVLTLLHRPGLSSPDDGTTQDGVWGSSADWAVAINFADDNPDDAEMMGAAYTVMQDTTAVCRDDGECDYFPNPDQANGLPDFAGFNGRLAQGNWTLCVGDHFEYDQPTLNSWTLNVEAGSDDSGDFNDSSAICPFLMDKTGCVEADQSILKIKAGKTVLWKYQSAELDVNDALLGVPASDGLALCFYDANAHDLRGLDIPDGEFDKATKSGWKTKLAKDASVKKHLYKSKSASPSGVKKALLKNGKAQVKSLNPPALPLEGDVVVQLRHPSTGLCLQSSFSEADVKKNDDKKFVAKSAK